jgi:hypothetical protein
MHVSAMNLWGRHGLLVWEWRRLSEGRLLVISIRPHEQRIGFLLWQRTSHPTNGPLRFLNTRLAKGKLRTLLSEMRPVRCWHMDC